MQLPASARGANPSAPRGQASNGEKGTWRQDGHGRLRAAAERTIQELKKACGTGGAVVEGGVELQGDLRDRVRDVLAKRGFAVKG